MNLSYFIARRYFLSKKKTNFINIISIISMIGVGVGTMALVIVLSVFNGLEDLFRSLHGTFDSEINIKPAYGKSLTVTPQLLAKIRAVEGVGFVAEIIEDNVFLSYRKGHMPARMRGVPDQFIRQNGLDQAIIAGNARLKYNDKSYAIVGSGVQYILSIALKDEMNPIQIWYPDNSRKTINVSSPESIRKSAIRAGGVFALEQRYDKDYIFVPLSFAADLLQMGNKRSSLEISLKDGEDVDQIKVQLKKALGANYLVQDRDEQHASLLQAIRIEKLFVYITFSVILAVASFNIFFSLTMLAIDKRKDVAVLSAMGAAPNFIRRVFMTEGAIIATVGTLAGLGSGFLICLAQQTFGIFKMGMESAIVDAYPVKMQLPDFVATGITIALITFVASYFPAVKAAKDIDIRL
ncbi:ABC transporter permease [Cytophagaceae bacterium DM2B3-1]|uniref:ABC transporter permease n=1 Tax=Xanthocytophaga flava TaxID=3048013 RepID=A0ABT7CSJ6_9BACT|nr:FtsX-like permease family protein [Xanthocytophaga flavus]MDJ1471399.1 ABC transporter permease [Xanthocytophaga flavus]MDJ1496725.1 ABC transporter permease [Xanthocytophaga flavus]